MKNYKTLKVMYGKGMKYRIADFMHRHGLIKIIYQVPIVDAEGNTIGYVYTMRGNSKALWIMSKLFEKEVSVQPFWIDREKRFEVV